MEQKNLEMKDVKYTNEELYYDKMCFMGTTEISKKIQTTKK